MTVTWRDRLAARRAGFSTRRAQVLTPPAPPVIGNPDRGAALVSGRFALHQSRAVEIGTGTLWDVPAPTRAFEQARQDFGWLDDLAALGTAPARRRAHEWVTVWLTAQGHGAGPGWTLYTAADRLAQLLAHRGWLLSAPVGVAEARLDRALARHRRFVQARFRTVPPGPDGLCLAARIVSAAARLEHSDALLARAQDGLDRACPQTIDAAGGVMDRAPDTLGRAVCALADAALALVDAGLGPHPEHARALARAAPVLRALRHANGALARFHGGGAGDVARIDAALAALRGSGAAPARFAGAPSLPMGYARLARGRVTVIADMAAPPTGREAAGTAHASTLGFEMTHGRAPLIVNCGAGAAFGPDWHDAARHTASHSAVILADRASSVIERARGGAMVLTEAPGDVQVDLHADAPDMHVVGAHNGYAKAFGLIHARRLDLSLAGDLLTGEDMLTAATTTDQRRFAPFARQGGVPFAIRFHLHPDVDARLDPSAGAVRLTLPTRDVWHFSHDGLGTIRLDPSVYLEKTRAQPAACRQIVLSGRAAEPVTSVRWRLERDRATRAFDPPDPGGAPQ